MEIAVIIVFALGYLAITLEHNLKVDKMVAALATMAVAWAIIALGHLQVFEVDTVLRKLVPTHLEEILLHHLGKTAEILFFLIGAMTIVEIIDHFDGFSTIKSFVKTKKKSSLLWIFCILGFVLSAIIDNLTATIVLITILKKIIEKREQRIWFVGLIIISANAGGAWSPIGDVTTTMLWMANKVSADKLVMYLFVPSLACMVVTVFIASRMKIFKGEIDTKETKEEVKKTDNFGAIMLYLGLSAIVFVPIFKTITHLPPYMGMMLSLSLVALFAEVFSRKKFEMKKVFAGETNGDHAHSPIHTALTKIEMPSILFFLGILLAVAALESLGQLFHFAGWLNTAIPNSDIVVMIFGVASAIIDNVPLVAASIGMFSEPANDFIWHFIAYSAGTGGSMLIIGSAAGVVAMGMEKIDFFWYFKKIAWLAFIGFIVGAVVFMGMRTMF